MDLKLEVVVLPVADVDRAKAFYTERLGFRLDADFPVDDGYRVVRPASPSIQRSIREIPPRSKR
ncbi:VOC family protein [Nocardia gipuzkoensis]|jgi:catechol 2,3-dioxygenase-like lactoylglutathione lyase family enzyme